MAAAPRKCSPISARFSRLAGGGACQLELGDPSSLFTEKLECRSRCLVVHPINPRYLIPVTEVVTAPWTSPEVVARTRDLLISVGQAPIGMKREVDAPHTDRPTPVDQRGCLDWKEGIAPTRPSLPTGVTAYHGLLGKKFGRRLS